LLGLRAMFWNLKSWWATFSRPDSRLRMLLLLLLLVLPLRLLLLRLPLLVVQCWEG
jgi:hypothetical protein